MKKMILFFFLAIFAINQASAQSTEPTVPKTKADYLKISRTQKTGGFVLLGVGALCIGIAAPGNVSFDILPVLVIGGAGSILGSIPLFLASAKNKKRANKMSASIQMMTEPVPQRWSMGRAMYPAVSIRINL